MTAGSGRRQASPDPPSGRGAVPDEILLLAAIDRAARHGEGRSLKRGGARKGAKDRIGVPIFFVARHLGDLPGTRIRRRLRKRLDEATENGWLECLGSTDPTVWVLTPKGHQALARHQGRVSAATRALPESPQHQAWREARHIAELQIAELRDQIRAALDQSSAVAGKESTESAIWLRLADASQRLAGATYCLYEWPEPDDAKVDVAQPPGVGALRKWRRWSLTLEPGA